MSTSETQSPRDTLPSTAFNETEADAERQARKTGDEEREDEVTDDLTLSASSSPSSSPLHRQPQQQSVTAIQSMNRGQTEEPRDKTTPRRTVSFAEGSESEKTERKGKVTSAFRMTSSSSSSTKEQKNEALISENAMTQLETTTMASAGDSLTVKSTKKITIETEDIYELKEDGLSFSVCQRPFQQVSLSLERSFTPIETTDNEVSQPSLPTLHLLSASMRRDGKVFAIGR